MTKLAEIRDKIIDRIRISEEEALFLFESPNLLEVGQLADMANRRKNGNLTYYNVNRHINPTNICALSCKFCAYSRKPGEEGGYEYSIEEILEKVGAAVKQQATEIHMVGGLHPRWRLSHFTDILETIKRHYPGIHIKGFTAVELDWLARRSKMRTKELILCLQQAGLDSLPGGGAEIFHQDIRDEITAKLSADQWIDIHRTAHNLGMHSNATMLYGHVESFSHRVDHMRYLRALQDETNGFNAFIPLSFQPHNNEMGISKYTYGADDLRTLAVARLYLDNFQHIKAYWIMLGQDIAQLGLHFGANDLDGTVTEEKISNMAGSQAGIAMSRAQITGLITRTGHDACERDTLYQELSSVEYATTPRSPSTASATAILEQFLHANRADTPDLAPQANSSGLSINYMEQNISTSEALTLADSASFFDLTTTANKVTERIHGFKRRSFGSAITISLDPGDLVSSASFTTRLNDLISASGIFQDSRMVSLNIDLSHINEPEIKDTEDGKTLKSKITINGLARLVKETKKMQASVTPSCITVIGLSELWQIAQNDDMLLAEAFTILRQNGVNALGSASNDSETGLTTSEVIELHRAAHLAGLKSSAKIEISSTQKLSEMMWPRYLDRVSAFNSLNQETGSLMALCIEPSIASNISVNEFLRVIAITRIVAGSIPNISTSILTTPVMKQSSRRTGKIQTAEQKIAALGLICGANDLGTVSCDQKETTKIAGEIESVACLAILRNGLYQDLTTTTSSTGQKSEEIARLGSAVETSGANRTSMQTTH